MNVFSTNGSRGPRIHVILGGNQHVLTAGEAEALYRALAEKLGRDVAANVSMAASVLTDREALIWAAEYVRAAAQDVHATVAVRSAFNAVNELRGLSAWLPDDVKAMLAAMTGGGR